MDKEYSLEFAFWGFLKNKGVSATEIEEDKALLATMLKNANCNFKQILGAAVDEADYSAKEKKLLEHLNSYHESMLKEQPSCEVDVSKLDETELQSLLSLLDENGVELFVGEMYGLQCGPYNYSEEEKMFSCSLFVHDPSYIHIAFAKLLKKANVSGEVNVYACSFERAYEMIMTFKNAKLVANEQKNYFDNLESLEKLEERFKAQGVTVYLEGLDDPKNPFVIAREYDEVFKQFANPEITELMYWVAKGRGEDALEYLDPKTFEDLKFLWTVAYTSNSKEQMIDIVERYKALRDGKAKVPADLPDELKKTYGLWVYETQEAAAKASGIECEFEKPALELVAKIQANGMYKFAYLCAKYGVHKNLLSVPAK